MRSFKAMNSNRIAPQRHLIRLKNYDYSQPGAYFITVCTKKRHCLFGNIKDDQMWLNSHGVIVGQCWIELPQHYANVKLDSFVVMPNHIHGIIFFEDVGAGFKPAPTDSTGKRYPLSEIVRAFKTFSSRQINQTRNMPGTPVWQRNYYEHVIRRDESLAKIREYIENNPLLWELDRENPARQK